MENRKEFMKKGTDQTQLKERLFPCLPIIEIAGEKQVLIENHFGVKEYGCEQISVRMRYGLAVISGSQLELRQMTKEQLVISGRINAISLIRRNNK